MVLYTVCGRSRFAAAAAQEHARAYVTPALRARATREGRALRPVRIPALCAVRSPRQRSQLSDSTQLCGALHAVADDAGETEPNEASVTLFNRKSELASLADVLAEPPAAVIVMTGPPSCGKSVLLKKLVANMEQTPRPTIIDCRAGDYLNPAAFSANLVQCMQNDWKLDDKWLFGVVPSLAKLTLGGSMQTLGAEVKMDFLKAELQKDPRSALQTIMDAYLKLAREAKQKNKVKGPWPVIIIDEANRLKKWEEKSSESLDSLLAFFVYLTKQEELAHVILASSDTFLTEWLENGPIESPYRSVFVVGDLTHDEAHTYFFDHVLPLRKQLPDAKQAWKRVFEVCGGNPGLLKKCALEVTKSGSWESGCDMVVKAAMQDISKGLRPETEFKGAAWRPKDFRRVLRAILTSRHAAVPISELEDLLSYGFVLAGKRFFGRPGAAEKLKSMNEMNLLVRRMYDITARDLDASAFGRNQEDVYTLPSAAHVCAARLELDL